MCLAIVAALSGPLVAHVGSPDVFVEDLAGPYKILVTVRPPLAIPGVAEVEILVPTTGVRTVQIVPSPLTGEGARFAPSPDKAARSDDDPARFTGHLWMMSAGAWQIRVTIDGDSGTGTLSVPVPMLPQATKKMSVALGAILFAAMLLLVSGIVAIVSAMAREGALEAGESPEPAGRRRGRIAGAIAGVVVTVVVSLGSWWWSAEAAGYERYVYKPLEATPMVSGDGSLRLEVHDPGWIALRRLDDFVPDHGHLMHLFIVSPSLDRLWHLHPRLDGHATFEQVLPQMPAGSYEFFADVVHATGISETVTGHMNLAEPATASLTGDDSAWTADRPASSPDQNVAVLPHGGRIVWVRGTTPLRTKQLTMFTFRVEDARGNPASDLELYMGMPGHAVFVRRDRRVFAHVHPSGSAPMAALEIGRQTLVGLKSAAPMVHAHADSAVPSTVTFPYGLPEPGDYRIFVQVKRADHIDTGAFDVKVE
jgi:hypothetical protein